MIAALTPLQQEAMIFIGPYLKAYGIAPSYREVAIGLGFRCKAKAGRILESLEAAGLIERNTQARTIGFLPAKYHDASNCECADCSDIRYLARLKLVEALEVAPPTCVVFGLGHERSNLRLYTPPEIRSQSSTKAVQG